MRLLTGSWPYITIKRCGTFDLDKCICCCIWDKVFGKKKKSNKSNSTSSTTSTKNAPHKAFQGMEKSSYSKSSTLPVDSQNKVPPPYNPELEIHAV